MVEQFREVQASLAEAITARLNGMVDSHRSKSVLRGKAGDCEFILVGVIDGKNYPIEQLSDMFCVQVSPTDNGQVKIAIREIGSYKYKYVPSDNPNTFRGNDQLTSLFEVPKLASEIHGMLIGMCTIANSLTAQTQTGRQFDFNATNWDVEIESLADIAQVLNMSAKSQAQKIEIPEELLQRRR